MIYSRVAEYRMCAPRPGRRLDLDPAGTSSSPLPSRMATGNTPSKARLAALGRHVCQSRQQPQPQPEPAGGILKWVGQLFTGGGGDARPAPGGDATLRIGIIGLDTSHVPAFTDCLNNPDNEHHVPGALVVAAVKGGSPDMPASADRVEGYTQQLVNDYDVTIYDTVGEMCEHVDAVFLESVDGRAHLAQAAPVIAAGKPLFIDKPMAGSLADGMEIFRLAAQAGGVPVWSSSALRYGPQQQAVRAGSLGAPPDYALTTSPATLNLSVGQPDLFGYGVHGVESLFTAMGTGCEAVRRGTTSDGKIEVTGFWAGGRTGIFRESNPPPDGDRPNYTGVARAASGAEAAIGGYDGYAPLVRAAITAFQTGVVPVESDETLEILAFMEAADLSAERGGASVTLAEVMQAAAAAAPPSPSG